MSLPVAPFGRTGHVSSRIIFGAAALGAMSQGRADATLDQAFDAGINHIDTAASYGESELRLAPWLKSHRKQVFLASKTGERDGRAARIELERSLDRLGIDQLDLIQLHNLVEPDQWEQAHRPDGAVAALAQARDEGLVRHIGVTGHGVRIAGMHLRSLDEFEYDSVLLPWNFTMLTNPAYRHDAEALVARCAERNIAVQTIKSIARGRWAPDYGGPRFSWYEPLEDPSAIARAVRWVLGHPQLFLNTSSDARKLAQAIAAAQHRTIPTAEQMQADVDAIGITALFDGDILERI